MCCVAVVLRRKQIEEYQREHYLLRRRVSAFAISFCMSALAFSALTLATELHRRMVRQARVRLDMTLIPKIVDNVLGLAKINLIQRVSHRILHVLQTRIRSVVVTLNR